MTGRYENGNVQFDGLIGEETVFHKTITTFFKRRIADQYPLDLTPENPLQVQKEAHEAFLDSRSQYVFGRDKLVNKIED